MTLHHFADGRLRVYYKERRLAFTAYGTYAVPDPAEDDKTLDARVEAIVVAQQALAPTGVMACRCGVCHGAHSGEGPVPWSALRGPSLAMLALKGALRVAPGWLRSSLPLRSAPCLWNSRPGRESRLLNRTGKPGWRDRNLGLSIPKGDISAERK